MHCLKLFQYSFVLFTDYESERTLDTLCVYGVEAERRRWTDDH